MLLKHFFIEKIAHSSYLLCGMKTCAVVDPSRDVDGYLREARSRGLRITHILETHLHADFVSGHLDLARATGAKIYAPRSAGCEFEHVPLAEGDTVELEDMLIGVLETPGHTPEHVCYVVTDRSRGDEPAGVFCGDTLFVGDVGRPDLFPETGHELAGRLYHSLHDKLLELPEGASRRGSSTPVEARQRALDPRSRPACQTGYPRTNPRGVRTSTRGSWQRRERCVAGSWLRSDS